MSIQIEYSSQDEIEEELENLLKEQNSILDNNMEEWFETIVVPEVQRMATAMFLPLKFIESISFVKSGKNTGKIINTFGSRDVPLAIWFNYGTKRNYLIEPKVTHPKGSVRAARDSDDIGGGSVQHPTKLHWVDEFGQDQFRFSVIHPGFPKSLAMEFGVQQGIKRLKSQLPKLLARENQ